MKLTERSWRYHSTKKPRIFEIGETPGPEWFDSPDKIPHKSKGNAAVQPPGGSIAGGKINVRKMKKAEVMKFSEELGLDIPKGEHWTKTRSRVAKELKK